MPRLLSLIFLALPIAAGEPPASHVSPPTPGANAAAAAPASPDEAIAVTPSLADFRPSRHGFAFVNSFSGSPLPPALEALEGRLNVPQRFGLCGGMSFAAADYFLAGRPLREEISQIQPPAQGTPLYDYLYQRQTASLGPMAIMATKFLEWMQLPEAGDDGTHARTLMELEAIEAAVERGEPVMIGLVFVIAGERAVWNNHQVLVYAIEGAGPDDATRTLRIYDPNYPDNDDVVIRWRPEKEVDAEPTAGRWERIAPREGRPPRITRVRGFFQMPFAPVTPPAPAK